MALADKIQAYLTQNAISIAPNAFITGIPAGEEDQVLHWDTATLGAQPTNAQLDAAWQIKLAQDAAIAYQGQRAAEYPSFADQFDLLYHGGYDAWKAAVQAVKNKYPKGA